MTSTMCDALLGGAEGLVHPLLMKAIFDGAARRDDFGSFAYLVLAYLALGLVMNTSGYFLSLWQMKIDNQIVGEISVKMLGSYYEKNYGDVLRNGSGHYVARIRSDVKDGLVPMLALVRTITVKCVTFMGLISVLVVISWQAFLSLSIIIPVAALISIGVGKKIQALTSVERENEAVLMSVLARSVAAFRMVCTFDLVSRTTAPVAKTIEDVLASGYSKFRVIRLLQRTSDLVMVVCDCCSILVGAIFVFNKRMSIGSFIAFMNAFWRSATTLIDIFKLSAEMQSHVATVGRVIDFMTDIRPPSATERGEQLNAEAIGFSYENQTVIGAFSIHLTPGQSALILGKNGTGKTTLANILAGHLAPSCGRLCLPRRISATTLPIAFPPVKVGDLCVDPGLLSSLHMDLAAIADALPDQLSAGQQQKLSLGMALSRDADLYILDEPMANLDTSSQAVAMLEIRRRTQGKMLIIIMHGSEELHATFDQIHRLDATSASAGLINGTVRIEA